eukprot:CAMPEP_0194033938 /NCGR_PEP_ID=MMETSP0009_2-20130614/6407_1 /TAXON_ID=210454 /ORGANISM="Grammatophora oceanica, Strain CCMP 410" /LENGTH=221 /DNA_ID=CAMNT_0038674669 /DNA_START=185 /DNA_END=850 /DNA_ORIENTATION=+
MNLRRFRTKDRSRVTHEIPEQLQIHPDVYVDACIRRQKQMERENQLLRQRLTEAQRTIKKLKAKRGNPLDDESVIGNATVVSNATTVKMGTSPVGSFQCDDVVSAHDDNEANRPELGLKQIWRRLRKTGDRPFEDDEEMLVSVPAFKNRLVDKIGPGVSAKALAVLDDSEKHTKASIHPRKGDVSLPLYRFISEPRIDEEDEEVFTEPSTCGAESENRAEV